MAVVRGVGCGGGDGTVATDQCDGDAAAIFARIMAPIEDPRLRRWSAALRMPPDARIGSAATCRLSCCLAPLLCVSAHPDCRRRRRRRLRLA